MKIHASVMILALILTGCSVSFSPGTEANLPRPTAGTRAEQVQAIRAAREYLALIDSHQYDATWERAGSSLKGSSSKFVWTNMLKLTTKTIEASVKRDVEALGFSTRIDQNVPVGSYVLVQFKSQGGAAVVTEKIVMQKEQGVWMIIGYFIVKRARFGAST